MEELVNKLNAIPNSYFGFVAGIVTYAKMKPERLKKVMDFIDSSNDLTPSDVVKFVMLQPDFHEYGLGVTAKEKKLLDDADSEMKRGDYVSEEDFWKR